MSSDDFIIVTARIGVPFVFPVFPVFPAFPAFPVCFSPFRYGNVHYLLLLHIDAQCGHGHSHSTPDHSIPHHHHQPQIAGDRIDHTVHTLAHIIIIHSVRGLVGCAPAEL